ncbi:MAG: tRNA pseudouridine(38-40) synthase TruA, partial [Clostridiales bacterium]|nr:tRNA pseudouridine(38-40) synthase TruA [Clostridiales bacterium]
LEAVLERMCGATVEVIGAGRTDAGVHAKGMVASFQAETQRAPEEIRNYLNRYLPDDIAVKEVREAAPRFHARYKAVGKTYCYTCFDGPVKPVFNRRYVTRLDAVPDLEAMRRAAAVLQGEHDFRSFCGNPKMKKSTVRTVDTIEIVRKGGYLYFNVHGTGFLQNMVRILVGTLLEVGYGRMKPEQMADILEARDRRLAGPTAPPEGLCLVKVDY